MHKIEKNRYCVHNNSINRLNVSREWSSDAIKWAKSDHLLDEVVTPSEGEVDAVLGLLGGEKD